MFAPSAAVWILQQPEPTTCNTGTCRNLQVVSVLHITGATTPATKCSHPEARCVHMVCPCPPNIGQHADNCAGSSCKSHKRQVPRSPGTYVDTSTKPKNYLWCGAGCVQLVWYKCAVPDDTSSHKTAMATSTRHTLRPQLPLCSCLVAAC